MHMQWRRQAWALGGERWGSDGGEGHQADAEGARQACHTECECHSAAVGGVSLALGVVHLRAGRE